MTTSYCSCVESTIKKTKKVMPRSLADSIIKHFGDDWRFMAAAYDVDTKDVKTLQAHEKCSNPKLVSDFYTNNKHDILEWIFLEKINENPEQSFRYTSTIESLKNLTKEQTFEGMHKENTEHYEAVSSALALASVAWFMEQYIKIDTALEESAHMGYANAFM